MKVLKTVKVSYRVVIFSPFVYAETNYPQRLAGFDSTLPHPLKNLDSAVHFSHHLLHDEHAG